MREKTSYKFANKKYISQLLKHDIDYFRVPLKLIKKYCDKNMSIVDFGCGTGNFVKILNELGYKNVVGIDIDKDIIIKGRKINDLDNIFTLEEVNLKELKFDVVTCIYVIEHIENVKSFLNTLLDMLNDGGILIIVTPNYLNPRTYLAYIKSKMMHKNLHLTPFNKGNTILLFMKFLKASFLTVLKLFFNNNYIWKVEPLPSLISVGGDADACWVSNYLDIRNYLKAKGIKEVEKKSFKEKICTNYFTGRK